MKYIIISALALVCLSCATIPLAQREFSFVEETKVTKNVAYQNALAYLGRNLGDSKEALRVQDKEAGRLITRIIIPCDEAKMLMTTRGSAEYSLELEFKDKKTRITFVAIDLAAHDLVGKRISRVIAREGDLADAKACAEREKANLVQAINGQEPGSAKKSDNW